MKNYIKIIFAFSGIILALGIAGAAFVIAAKPFSDFQLKINYLVEYEFYAEALKADMFRTAVKGNGFSASDLKNKLNETEQYYSNFKKLVYSVKDESEVNSAYTGYENANKKLFQNLEAWRQEFEASSDSSEQTFKPVLEQFDSVKKNFEALKTAYQNLFMRQEKKAKAFSIMLMITAWGIGVFLTWLVSSVIYSIYIERERAKKAKLRLHLGPKTENKNNGENINLQEYGAASFKTGYTPQKTETAETLKNLKPEKNLFTSGTYDTASKPEKALNSFTEASSGIEKKSTLAESNFNSSTQNRFTNRLTETERTSDSNTAYNNQNYLQLKDEYAKLKTMSEELETAKTELAQKYTELEDSYLKLKNEQSVFGNDKEERVEQVRNFLQDVQITAANAQDDAMVAADLVNTFKEGHKLFKTTYEKIIYINQSISAIKEMAEVISGIAEQTKMLSMNAAIEAAHAGEYGKGFAVVAEELGRLAAAALESSSDIGKTVMEVVKSISVTAKSSESLDKAFTELNLKTDKMYTAVSGFSDRMVSTFQKTDEILNIL